VLVSSGKPLGAFHAFAKAPEPLHRARSLPEHPESFPVNALVPIKGTPLEHNDVSSTVLLLLSTLSPGIS
jgi:biotin synthase